MVNKRVGGTAQGDTLIPRRNLEKDTRFKLRRALRWQLCTSSHWRRACKIYGTGAQIILEI